MVAGKEFHAGIVHHGKNPVLQGVMQLWTHIVSVSVYALIRNDVTALVSYYLQWVILMGTRLM